MEIFNIQLFKDQLRGLCVQQDSGVSEKNVYEFSPLRDCWVLLNLLNDVEFCNVQPADIQLSSFAD